jgi:hypothetical protein
MRPGLLLSIVLEPQTPKETQKTHSYLSAITNVLMDA